MSSIAITTASQAERPHGGAVILKGFAVVEGTAAVYTVVAFAKWWQSIVDDTFTAPLLIGISLDIGIGVTLAIYKSRFRVGALTKGLLRKLAELFVIAMAFAAQRFGPDDGFSYGHWTCLMVFLWEFRSVVRTAAKFGLPTESVSGPIIAALLQKLRVTLDAIDQQTMTVRRELDRDAFAEKAKLAQRKEDVRQFWATGELTSTAEITPKLQVSDSDPDIEAAP